jgi:hypothetical protein
MRKELTHAAKKQRGSFYTTGGMCGRRGTKEYLTPCNINEFQVATSAKEEVDLCISAFRMR